MLTEKWTQGVKIKNKLKNGSTENICSRVHVIFKERSNGSAQTKQTIPELTLRRAESELNMSYVSCELLWNNYVFLLVFLRLFGSIWKYVLAVGSSVFHAMFYGELAENKDEIHIPDVEPAAFLAMLK